MDLSAKAFAKEIYKMLRKSMFEFYVLEKENGGKSEDWINGYFEAVKDLYSMTEMSGDRNG